MPHVLSRSWGWRRRLALIALLATLAVALGLGTGGRFGVGPLVQVAHASAACTGTPRIKATSPRDNLPGGIGYLYAYVQEYVHADGSFCGSNAKGLVHLNEGAASGQMNVRLYDCSGHFLDDMDADVTVHAPTPYTEVWATTAYTGNTCVHALARFWFNVTPHDIYQTQTANVSL